ncbi:MAG: choline-sulfatase [Rhodospirillaceae bacterium]|jgi:choline-sulfatase|uniref:choline-sulfatase n=1 Tax=Hwanghaeella sp. 1Z406 TaxID=3402811 RepID=UPI000C51A35C|nr:choline-sulfatase [Rhodospirillales bacterium]MAO93705.1 choline-sulfatase [Rhodospirillales bacterium]MAX46795.1 choline-sulfatase [Rhodospirillaceae bacterium]|tara:strand:+ start:3714 stop:5267 length:1554 start_codon:yes stop_codon:yes gene_type:complete
MAPRNILIVMADQLTPFMVGCYGNPVVKTPHMDALAAQGVRFDAAYSNSPLCTPGRYAFMTGQYISRFGGWDNAAYLPSTVPTFAHYLRLMGYRTGLAGKMHFVGADQLHGFEERHTTDVYPADFGWVPDWRSPEKRIDLWYHNMSSVVQAGPASITNQLAYDDEVGAATLRAIYDAARTEDERPFCYVASFIHPHDPYAARPSYWDLYDDADIPMPHAPRPNAADNDPHSLRLEHAIALDAVDIDDADIRRARRAYMANVSYVDDWLGKLGAALVETGQADDTAILLVSDHGDMLGERGLWYKMTFREWACRIPMVLHVPGRAGQGVSIANPVSQVDVTPTLLQLAHEATGAPIPDAIDPLDGTSLLQFVDGTTQRDTTVAEYTAEGTGQAMLMLRDGSWKYICCPGDPDQLFDLASDPNEEINLADAAEQAPRMADFRARAQAHWDPADIHARVLDSQNRRRVLSAALRIGQHTGWDWQPKRDATQEYTRSHMDLTSHDITSRSPRPVPFKPKWS